MFDTIIFDMDGTIADLYGVENWLQHLTNENTLPYEQAKPIYDSETLNELLIQLLAKGYKLKIKTWLSKNGSKEYNKKVSKAKEKWLKKYNLYQYFDSIDYLNYGVDKFEKNAIIVDDDNRVLDIFKKRKQKIIDAKGDIIKPLQEIAARR